jgi:hypothetical protein
MKSKTSLPHCEGQCQMILLAMKDMGKQLQQELK